MNIEKIKLNDNDLEFVSGGMNSTKDLVTCADCKNQIKKEGSYGIFTHFDDKTPMEIVCRKCYKIRKPELECESYFNRVRVTVFKCQDGFYKFK